MPWEVANIILAASADEEKRGDNGAEQDDTANYASNNGTGIAFLYGS